MCNSSRGAGSLNVWLQCESWYFGIDCYYSFERGNQSQQQRIQAQAHSGIQTESQDTIT